MAECITPNSQRSLYHLSSLFQREICLRGRQELVDSMTPCLHSCFCHCAHVDMHALVDLVVFLEAAVSFISEISSSDTRGKRPLFVCLVEQNEDFHQKKYCAVVLQSGGCLPPLTVVAKRETMLWRAELHLNMSTYPRRNLSGLLA